MQRTESGTQEQGTPRLRARVARSVGGVLVAGLAAAGCDFGAESGCVFWGYTIFRLTSGVAPKGDPGAWRVSAGDRTARIAADHDTLTFVAPADVPAPSFAEVTIPSDLVPPFRVECTVGLCDPAFYPAPTAVFGLSVVERTGALREFSADCSRSDGITATASFGSASPRAFAGAEVVDLALEHDGSALVASARDRERGGAWFEISRTPLAAQGPFLPRLSVRGFEPGQMVSYYSLRVPTNAPYGAGQATAKHQAVRAMAEAIGALADGAVELASASPDVAAAALRMESAKQLVEGAVTALDASVDPGKRDPAARRARRARKAALRAARTVSQAVAKLDVGGARQTQAAGRRIGAAARNLATAGDQILPDDLRAAIGGLTLKDLLRR